METTDGRVLCQLRDNKPGIAYPGFWTCTPGGHVARGESPRHAVRRELREEFEAKVRDLKLFKVVVRKTGKSAGVFHIFTAKLSSPETGLRCHEGQKASFLSPAKTLKLRQHPVSREVLKKYLNGKSFRLRRHQTLGR
ncbi:MAG: NUDIX domain-containing protein [Candidatus Omnitrophica bacterium]|nr:NUDIX domain-containing protein [Candidatus Omnitrophota bacterium]